MDKHVGKWLNSDDRRPWLTIDTYVYIANAIVNEVWLLESDVKQNFGDYRVCR